MLWVSTDGWMHLDSIQSKNLLLSSKPSLTSASTLPQFFFSGSQLLPFRHLFGQLAELIFWELQTDLKWLMLHKWTRSFHSPRVKLPFVTMPANWCLVFCQITNQMQLCGFWIHVSLLDFCLQWSIQERRAELESWFGCWCASLMMCHATNLPVQSLCILSIVWKKNGTLQ